jgi:hypothetical protein
MNSSRWAVGRSGGGRESSCLPASLFALRLICPPESLLLLQALVKAIVNGHYNNSSVLLHLDKALEELHRGEAKHKRLFLSLIESLPLLRVGSLSWVDPGDLLKMERRPIRWGLAQGHWALATATAASVHQLCLRVSIGAGILPSRTLSIWLRRQLAQPGALRRSKVASASDVWGQVADPVEPGDASYNQNSVVVQAELGLLPIKASGAATALQPVLLYGTACHSSFADRNAPHAAATTHQHWATHCLDATWM